MTQEQFNALINNPLGAIAFALIVFVNGSIRGGTGL